MQLKAFLDKYKRTILSWIVFSSIVLYFAPKQSEYYLDKDISDFKTHFLQPALIWTGGILCIGLLILYLIKTRSVKQSLTAFLSATLAIALYLFIFQNLFLAACLFINRQLKQDSIQKNYIANYLTGTDQTKDNFILYDLTAKQIASDKKLANKLYKAGRRQNDTINLRFDKGIFGIVFQAQPFDDN